MFTHRLVALAALAAGASAGCDVCSEELFERTKGQGCGPFEREARGKWADWTTLAPDVSCLEDVCCALHEDDCCEPAAGPIAGLVIGAVVLVVVVLLEVHSSDGARVTAPPCPPPWPPPLPCQCRAGSLAPRAWEIC